MLNAIDSFSLGILAVVVCRSQSPQGGKFGFVEGIAAKRGDYDASHILLRSLETSIRFIEVHNVAST